MQQNQQYKKKRIYIYVQDNALATGIIRAVSDDGKEFCREVEQDPRENLFDDDSHAAKAFAEFERFCVDKCGLTDSNDEVIFANAPHCDIVDLFAYVDSRLGGVPWAVVKCIESDYNRETTHLIAPESFKQFQRMCNGFAEPYATKCLYSEYRRLIHKDSYTPQELDRMEAYVARHFDAAYSKSSGSFNVVCRISHVCAAEYHSDKARFLSLIEMIVQDFVKRRCKRCQRVLADILLFTADEVADDGYIDYATLAAEENEPPLERSEYSIFRAVAPEQLKIIKSILEEFD